MALMKLPNLVYLVLLTGASALAQNSDVGILIGESSTRISYGTDSNGTFARTQRKFILQVNYARQFYEGSKGRLYFEVPVSTAGAIFVTPGLRYHFNLSSRVAVYAAAGAGVAIRQRYSLLPVTRLTSDWRTSPGYDLGAGVDFRLTRLLSLRGEFRRFRTSAQPTLGYGRTFPSAQFGFALHF